MANRPKRGRRTATDTVSTPQATGPDGTQLVADFDRLWMSSRSGATAGRGYHYQDLVGAWVGLRMLTGDVPAERLVAEGLEDLSCEGTPGHEVQVKSRQGRIGEFGTGEAAKHVVDAWQRRANRAVASSGERVVVVLERAVAGYAPRDWSRPIGDDGSWQSLVADVRERARRRDFPSADVDSLLARTTIVVLSQQVIMAEAAALVGERTGLPIGVTVPVIQALRAAVADTADRNAEVEWDARAGLSRTDLQRIITDVSALVDRGSLVEAVANGSCEPINFDAPHPDPEFYSGSAVQPGHVAAGLVVPRPGPTDEVLAGLGSGRAVLVAGPSGIGKSAVVWLAAYVARHVVWYRVHRLLLSDVEPLIRMAKAAGAGKHGPVGFVVDGIGTGSLEAWDALQRRAAASPGVVLLGSVREEDTLLLATFGHCVVVRPRLEQDVATRIHDALVDSGATTQPHWREAFEQSEGLTLEFTHLLTQGRRLGEVVAEQVDTRTRERRDLELAVLAPVSVTDRWGANLSIDAVAELADVSAPDIKAALARLVDEHLVTVSHGVVEGLHPLRSAAICDAVHRVPPPTLAMTVRRTMPFLRTGQIASFLARAIADEPSLGLPIVDGIGSYLDTAGESAAITAAALAGLRLADFTATARDWVATLDEHDVPTPLRPLAINFGMTNGHLVDAFAPQLIEAVIDIRARRDDTTSALRDQLIAALGTARLASLLASASVVDATALLTPLAGTGLELAPPAGSLCAALEDAGLDELGTLIDAARAVSPSTGHALVDYAGGEQRILNRLQQEHPWLLEIAVVEDSGDHVLRGRVLHVADRLNPSPERYIKALAKQAMLCLPHVDRADLSTVLAGGAPLEVNGVSLFTSGLLRHYVHGNSDVAWNRARSRFARSLVAASSTTDRLAVGLEALERSADLLAELAVGWLTDSGAGTRLHRINRERSDLLALIQTLAPQRASEPIEATNDDAKTGLDNDPLHGVAQAIAQNLASRLSDPSQYASLAAFTRDTIRKQLQDAEREPWSLLGHDTPPPALARLKALIEQLAAVVAELAFGDTTSRQIAKAARAVPRGKTLGHVAAFCTTRALSRYETTIGDLVREASHKGLTIEVLSKDDSDAKAVTWPARATALIAHVDGHTFADVLSVIVDLLGRFPLPDSSATVIPMRDGVPLPRFTARVFGSGNIYPLSDEALPWLELLPDPRPTPCLDATTDGLEALRELSSIAYLASHRSCDQAAQQAADHSVARFRGAREALASLADDDVTVALADALDELADRVQDEFDTPATTDYLASRFALGLEDQSQDIGSIQAMIDVAVEWDHDPAEAVALMNIPEEE